MAEVLKVLVVDDEPGMRLAVVRALEGWTVHAPDVSGEVSFAVSSAESGTDALAQIKATRPHILLLDHKLPDITGLDVLARLSEAQPDASGEILTIMITAYAALETAVAAIKLGADDFLAKPFTPAELRTAVRKAAGRIILAQTARRLTGEKRQVRFQFISVLAHELKAPLAVVEGYLRVLHDRSAGPDPAVYDHMAQRSLVRVEGMRKLIDDLLDLTRIESGQKSRRLVDLDIVPVARAVIETFAEEAARRQITLALSVEGPLPVKADRGELEIILNNLLANAIKYNRPGGRADVTLRLAQGVLTLEVKDTGIGLTAQDAARLFDDFVRIKNEQTRAIAGSGLGLSIVRKLAHLYGGEAALTSQSGVGSTFTVTLPACSGAGQADQAGSSLTRPSEIRAAP